MGDFGLNWRRLVNISMAVAFVFGLALLASQHLQHIAGVLPYLLLLACPLMHFFGHGRHHSHHLEKPTASSDTPTSSATGDLNHGY